MINNNLEGEGRTSSRLYNREGICFYHGRPINHRSIGHFTKHAQGPSSSKYFKSSDLDIP